MKFKKPSFHPVPAAIGLLIAALVSWGLSHWTELPFWGTFSLVGGAMFINGVIAQKEDDAPAGFNKPLPPQSSKKEPILK